MSEVFKKLRGTRILISIPERKASAIELTAKDEAMIEAEARKTWSTLEVYAVGEGVEEGLKVGDKVYVPAASLEFAERIEVEGKMKFMIREQDIAIIW